MKQKHGTSEYMNDNLFYSYSALMIVFDKKVAKIMKKKWGITEIQLRHLAAVRLFTNRKGFGAKIYQIMKLLDRDKFYVSRILKSMMDLGYLKRKKRGNTYDYTLDELGNSIVISWSKIMQNELQKFWEDRRTREYRYINLDEKFRPIPRNRELNEDEKID